MPKLRIVSVNDVYALDNLPRLATLVARWRREPADAMIVPLAGDFLAPSLLSSIDAGRGMVDCLNLVGITHVILGNHEDDLPPGELASRIHELAAPCLGTNVTSSLDLPRRLVLAVGDLRVGLVGVVMDDPSVYRGPPFDGATLAPANAAALEEAARLMEDGCAAVIALTHQSIADDRLLAATGRFPVIIGGHEHVPMLVDVDGTWIVKAGAEAVQAVITEVVFSEGRAVVTTRLDDVSQYEEDAHVRARVDLHLGRVRELAGATLLYLPAGEALSSVGTRSRQTSMGALICSRLRDALGANACLFNGGGIRAAHTYSDRLTYGDIEAEVPFDNEVVVVKLPGRVIRDAVRTSRAMAPAESGAFLQVDDRMTVNAANEVTAIDGSPLEAERSYDVAVVRELLLGLDHVTPLVDWAKSNVALVPPSGSGREPKVVLVQSFALAIWAELGGFDTLDTDHDAKVSAEEVAAAVALRHPSRLPSPVLGELVVRAVDRNADHTASRAEVDAVPGRKPQR